MRDSDVREAIAVLYWLAWTLPLWSEQQTVALKAANKAHNALGGSIPAFRPDGAVAA